MSVHQGVRGVFGKEATVAHEANPKTTLGPLNAPSGGKMKVNKKDANVPGSSTCLLNVVSGDDDCGGE